MRITAQAGQTPLTRAISSHLLASWYAFSVRIFLKWYSPRQRGKAAALVTSRISIVRHLSRKKPRKSIPLLDAIFQFQNLLRFRIEQIEDQAKNMRLAQTRWVVVEAVNRQRAVDVGIRNLGKSVLRKISAHTSALSLNAIPQPQNLRRGVESQSLRGAERRRPYHPQAGGCSQQLLLTESTRWDHGSPKHRDTPRVPLWERDRQGMGEMYFGLSCWP